MPGPANPEPPAPVLTTLAVQNYRSLRDLVVPLGRLTVVTGPNGSGKSNLYRALRLLADSARNGAVAALAREGGLRSTLWAGPETISGAMRRGERPVQGTVRTSRVALRLGFASEDYGYAVDFGLPSFSQTAFSLDPEIKQEQVWLGTVFRPATLQAERRAGLVRLRDDGGDWHRMDRRLEPFDSMLSEAADPRDGIELLALAERMRHWRFYDQLRTDAEAPARAVRIGTRTWQLRDDGADLAAALQTIAEAETAETLKSIVDAAFPGGSVEVSCYEGRFGLGMTQPGLLRPLAAAELSDGTLRFLLLAAALLTPRPPELIALNEPETSLHPDLLPALAQLIAAASRRTQVITVSHSGTLVTELAKADPELATIELAKDVGQTEIVGQGRFDGPLWAWPKR